MDIYLMKMETEETLVQRPRQSHKKGWIVVVLILLTAAVGAGIYFYVNHLRKTTADPIEMVPADAALVVQVNDYDAFAKATAALSGYISDAVPLGALNGMRYFVQQFSDQAIASPMTCSAHEVDGKLALLFSLRISQDDFDNLLKVLEINDNNFHTYKDFHVYQMDTHHCSFFFCYHDGAFTVSENEKLLNASLDCLAKQKSIVGEKGFQALRGMMDKNPKQNWLVVNHAAFVNSQKKNVAPEFADALSALHQLADWSAYQMTVSAGEISLTGYSVMKDGSLLKQLEGQKPDVSPVTASVVPAEAIDYACFRLSDLNRFSAASSLKEDAKKAFDVLKSDEIHCFTLADSLTYHYFAVKFDGDSAHLLSLLPEGHTLDSVGDCGSYRFGHGNFAPVLHAGWRHCTPSVFMRAGDYLVFADSTANLRKYQMTMKNGGAMENNQLFIFLKSDGRWSGQSSCRYFFQNGSGELNRVLSPQLVERHSNLTKTRCVAFYSLEPYQNLIPNHVYIKFLAQ